MLRGLTFAVALAVTFGANDDERRWRDAATTPHRTAARCNDCDQLAQAERL